MREKRGKFQSPFAHLEQAGPCCQRLNSMGIRLFLPPGALDMQILYLTVPDQVLVP